MKTEEQMIIENLMFDELKKSRDLSLNSDFFIARSYANENSLFFLTGQEIDEVLNRVFFLYDDVNLVNTSKRNALFKADLFKTKILTSIDIDVDQVDVSGRNALFYSDLETTKFLVEECKADYKLLTKSNKNLLFHCYDIEKFKYLESLGLDIFHLDGKGRCLFDKANFKCENQELIEYLVDKDLDYLI